jgi:hypothetical protein
MFTIRGGVQLVGGILLEKWSHIVSRHTTPRRGMGIRMLEMLQPMSILNEREENEGKTYRRKWGKEVEKKERRQVHS